MKTCGTIGANGKCLSSTERAYCLVSPGATDAALVKETWASDEECVMASGVAVCWPKPDTCCAGAEICVGSDQVKICNDQKKWETLSCPQCRLTLRRGRPALCWNSRLPRHGLVRGMGDLVQLGRPTVAPLL